MSLRLKTIVGVGLIEATLLAILISTVLNYMRNSNEEVLENYVNTTTTLFATTTKDAILSFDLASLESFIEEILNNQNVLYARIFDSENTLLAEGNKANYQASAFIVDRSYNDVDDNIYDAEAMITVDNISYGRIEMGFSTQGLESAIAETRQLAAAIALLEMVLVGLFSFALGVYLTRQLKVLRNSARAIAAGNLDKKITISTHDEIGDVAIAFNKMMDSLKKSNEEREQYHDELIDLNKTLEDRVERRTQKISEQKQKLESAYDQLKQTQKQLVQSEKMASIGQLAAGVAHEINNPVAFVKSNISSLNTYVKTYRQLIAYQQEILEGIDKAANDGLKEQIEHIQQFIEDEDIEFINEDIETLLSESIKGTSRVEEIVKGLKIYSRASDEVFEHCNINDCLEDTLKMLSNELKYACELVTDFNDILVCSCDRSKITQVFTNLVVNAKHAMADGGTITISTKAITEGGENRVQITIADTGKGIPPEHFSKLFDPFFTTKPVGEGTGLGLSISKGIIEDHGGTIDLESQVDIGTTFIIRLPAAV
ncbi:MAG: ATP-binding protein [Pseudomonadota bacterium]